MIFSMTGYGRASIELAETSFEVEIRTVNHRYLDLRVKLPRVLAPLEKSVRDCVQGRFARGKLELAVQASAGAPSASRVEIDYEAAGRYLEAAREIERRYGLAAELAADDLLGLPGVSRVVESSLDAAEHASTVLAGVEQALAATARMRASEGEGLEREFRQRLARVAELVEALEARSATVQVFVRERLRKRARELEAETGLLDEARLHQEVVLAADRLDVSEELSRLRSHLEQFLGVLDTAEAGSPVGRRLDFLLQELGREGNTVGSKANDAEMAHAVVELKTELERIREQVQNVE